MGKQHASRLRLSIATLILVSCIGCDQATKKVAMQTLRDAPSRSFFADTIRLEYALNPGGFLSFGSSLPEHIRHLIFVGFNSCFVLALCCYLCRRAQISWTLFISLVFILAGAIGNQIDRIVNDGLVTDFMSLGVGPLRTGVFNVADIALMFGGVAVVCVSIRDKPPRQNELSKPR